MSQYDDDFIDFDPLLDGDDMEEDDDLFFDEMPKLEDNDDTL